VATNLEPELNDFVSTFGLEPEPFLLITGTFNLFVKDRITTRLSGANSVQNTATLMRPRLSSKPFETIAFVRELSTLRNHKASTRFAQWKRDSTLRAGARGRGARATLLRTTKVISRPRRPIFGASRGGSIQAEKRSLGGSCADAKTLRGPLSPNANPVAGA